MNANCLIGFDFFKAITEKNVSLEIIAFVFVIVYWFLIVSKKDREKCWL